MTDFTQQRVYGPLRPLEFNGKLLSSASTERPSESVRWTILALYLKDDGSYLLQKVGESVVFHRLDSTCSRRAQFSLLNDLPDKYEPCDVCWPDDDVQMPNAVLAEQADFGIITCPTPEAVEKALTRKRKDRITGMEESYLSYPAKTILYEAAKVDTGIASLIQ
jgi:hypothetical protein